jgi:hypothetical protein
VFLYNNGIYENEKGSRVLGSRFHFLGVISAVFFSQDVNQVQVVSHPAGTPVVVSRQMIDLGVVFKARTVEETVEQFAAAKGVSLVDFAGA